MWGEQPAPQQSQHPNNPYYQGYGGDDDENDAYAGVAADREDDEKSTVLGHGVTRAAGVAPLVDNGNSNTPRASVASTWEGPRAM